MPDVSLSDMLEAFEDAALVLNPAGRILLLNTQAEKLLGGQRPELLDKPVATLLPERFRAAHGQHLAECLARRESRPAGNGLELAALRGDGGEIPVEVRLHRLDTGAGPLVLSVVRDISRHKHLEDKLHQSQKMEAIGRLAGGVAHDFSNMLMVIGGFSDILLGTLDAADPARELVEEIKKAAVRGASLTRQLLAFSRRQILAPIVLNLNGVVANMDRMLRRLIGEDIELVLVLDPNLPSVKADPGQLEQVLMNLAVNARDAMPRGGKLTIETRFVTLDEAYARARPEVQPGPYIEMTVSDNGFGMDAETLARIFEPFFTTKEQGKGTGLGLATVYGVIKQSSGYIYVQSQPNQGTTFKIYLPKVEELPPAEKEPLDLSSSPPGMETILLVEDEQAVRSLCRQVLQMNGYRVLEASYGDEALFICQQHKGRIHLLLTDVVMPGMSGRQLAERAQALRQKLKVLYMTGYAGDNVFRHGVTTDNVIVMQKPFMPDVLARKVREVLDTPRAK